MLFKGQMERPENTKPGTLVLRVRCPTGQVTNDQVIFLATQPLYLLDI